MLFPAIDTSDSKLSDNAAGIATINNTAPSIIVTVVRERFPSAVNADTIISYKLKEDVNVANKNKIKNKLKKNAPNGISPKAAGKTMNSKDRKSTRLNSSHVSNSYAVFCLKKKIACREQRISEHRAQPGGVADRRGRGGRRHGGRRRRAQRRQVREAGREVQSTVGL